MSWIGRAWRGEERLRKVFWVYGVLLGIGLGLVCFALKSAFGTGVYLAAKIIEFLTYGIWLLVAEWRCAFNVKWAFWGYVVRVLIVLSIIAIPLGIMFGGALIGQDLVKAAECRKELQAYVAQGGKDAEGFKRQCIDRQIHKTAGEARALPAISPEQARYSQLCRQAMTDVAQKAHVDPQHYIDQNQAYLQQCVQYYINRDNIVSKKAP